MHWLAFFSEINLNLGLKIGCFWFKHQNLWYPVVKIETNLWDYVITDNCEHIKKSFMWRSARFGNNCKNIKSTHGGVLLLVMLQTYKHHIQRWQSLHVSKSFGDDKDKKRLSWTGQKIIDENFHPRVTSEKIIPFERDKNIKNTLLHLIFNAKCFVTVILFYSFFSTVFLNVLAKTVCVIFVNCWPKCDQHWTYSLYTLKKSIYCHFHDKCGWTNYV